MGSRRSATRFNFKRSSGDSDEVDVVAVGNCLHAERHSEMRFADTRWAQQDDVLAVGEEAQRGQFLDLLAVNGGLKAEVEISQRLLKWKVSQPCLGQQASFGATGSLSFEESVEEVQVAQRFLGRLLGDGVEEVGDALQLQALEVHVHALVGDAHVRPS